MMNLAKLTSALLLLTFCENAFAQAEDHWESYIAAYAKGPATTSVNMSLKERAPVKDQRFLLVSTVTFSPCENGLPAPAAQETLEGMDDALERQVSFLGKTTLAGTRTQNCKRLNYFYIQDSMDVRFSLQTFYKDNFPEAAYTISIREDAAWKTYLDSLYPNELVQVQLKTTKILERLAEPDKQHLVFYAYLFPDEKSRKTFAAHMKQEGFQTALPDEKADNPARPWQVILTQHAIPNVQTISGMVLYLRKKVAEYGGAEDSWGVASNKN